ncbi:MAG: EVE domain-containing protein [Gammaproteobacteria bacterium]
MGAPRRYWLMKSEPGAYGIDDLAQRPGRRDHWDGVRNYQARNLMRDEMRPGDLAFFYHSSCEVPAIVGIMAIVGRAYPDPSALDPKHDHYDPAASRDDPCWLMVDVRLVRKLKRPITLAELKRHPALAGLQLLKPGNRLSVLPVPPPMWDYILGLEGQARE